MGTRVEHKLKTGNHVQVAHGSNSLSLVVGDGGFVYSNGGLVILTPQEAIDIGLDLIVQAHDAMEQER